MNKTMRWNTKSGEISNTHPFSMIQEFHIFWQTLIFKTFQVFLTSFAANCIFCGGTVLSTFVRLVWPGRDHLGFFAILEDTFLGMQFLNYTLGSISKSWITVFWAHLYCSSILAKFLVVLTTFCEWTLKITQSEAVLRNSCASEILVNESTKYIYIISIYLYIFI